MARIRTIKPEFWTAEQIMELSPMARLLFIGMWNFCDDKGVHPVAFKTLKAEVFPADDLLSSDVERMVGELISNGLLAEFEADGRRWWHVTGWHHQVINRPSRSRYPEPPRSAPLPSAAGQDGYDDAENASLGDGSCTTHGALTEHSMLEGSRKGGEGKGINLHQSPSAREPSDQFPMHLGWKPSDHFGELARMAGIAFKPESDPALGEFIAYWITQDRQRTQHEWDHAYLTNLKASNARKGSTAQRAQAPPAGRNGRQARVDNYAAQAAAARGNEDESGHGTERCIDGEAERVA